MGMHYLHTLDEYFANSKNRGFIESHIINPKISRWDILFFMLFFLFMTVLRFLVAGVQSDIIKKESILYNICSNTLLDKLNKKWEISKDGLIYKWKENFWFALWHGFSFVYNFILLLSMSGYLNNTNGWIKMCFKETTGKWFFLVTEEEFKENKRGWPYMYINNYVYYFYLIQMSFWTSCLFYLKYEKKRKDFYVFVLHHLSTILLLLYSHIMNFWRIGLLILFVHDIVDVALYISKTLNYSNPKYQKYLTTFYILFVFSYFFFRIILYLFYIVIPLSNMNVIKTYTDGYVTSYSDIPGGVFPVVFLWLLMVMHFYWFFLILKMTRVFIINSSKNEQIQDIRSDDESDTKIIKKAPRKGK
ncbi:translocation associated membrane protein, putative [Plasmodium malariae]|uniref:Translocation associated membrane protein, putative n=1 Tax=Plasmodium malariae TaxID=5858 RepID=A0A1C3KFZ2_PLAMA|nr:translocation associated membrane protein, putative [Plasmodium malariae]